jgi:hypothetical protein
LVSDLFFDDKANVENPKIRDLLSKDLEKLFYITTKEALAFYCYLLPDLLN